MKVDLLAAIGLTACAAVAISALAIGLGQSVTARVRLAVVFCAWFLLVTVLAATDALHYQHGIGILGLGATVVLPIAILFITGLRSAPAQQALLAIPLWLLDRRKLYPRIRRLLRDPPCRRTLASSFCSNRGLGRYYRGSHCRAACMVCV